MSEILQLIFVSALACAVVLFVALTYWTSQIIELSVRFYRLLLAAYPDSFRNEYGEAMVQLFRDTARDAYRRRGLLGLAAVWLRTLADFTISVIRQHRDQPVQASSESVLLRDFLQKWRQFASEALSVTAFSTWYGLHLLRVFFRRAALVWATLTAIAFGIEFASFFDGFRVLRLPTARVDLGGGVVQIWHVYDVGEPISDEQSKQDIYAWLERNSDLAARFSAVAQPWEFSFFTDIPGGSVIKFGPDRKPMLVRPEKSWRLRFPFGFLPVFLLIWTIRVYLRRNTASVAATQSA